MIDGATANATRPPPPSAGVGSGPFGVGVDPATHAVYVANTRRGNTVSVITPVTSPDLSLSDSAPATTVQPGHSYSYTLTAINTGGSDATGVTVIDTLPASAQLQLSRPLPRARAPAPPAAHRRPRAVRSAARWAPWPPGPA